MTSIDALLEIMARLRDPAEGCPWDVEQTFETIAPYTLEEAYEVDHAIRRGDMVELCDELGDLLLQVVFHAQMADEAGHFAFPDVVSAICNKLVRRHPHVFDKTNDGGVPRTASDQTRSWEAIKAGERAAKAARQGTGDAQPDPFDGIPIALPALSRATKLRKRAGQVSCESAESASDASRRIRKAIDGAIGRIAGGPLDENLEAGESEDRKARVAEIGRILAACVDLSRALGVDPELALREANSEYEERARADLEAKTQ